MAEYISSYIYNVISNVSRADEGRPLMFIVGDKVSPIEDTWRYEVQVTLVHVKSLTSEIL